VEQALVLLRRLGAVGEEGITDLGRTMARLPVHPRIGRLLIEGRRWGQPERVALSAALLSEREPFIRSLDRPEVDGRRAATPSDLLDRVEALEEHARTGRSRSVAGELNRGAARFVLQARDQLLRQVRSSEYSVLGTEYSADEVVMRALLAA